MKFRRSTSNPRVVIVVQNLPVPFDRRVWLEATTLQAAGYDVACICPKAKGFTTSREVIEGVEIYRYRIPFEARGAAGFVFEFLWCLLRTSYKVLRLAQSRPIDVLHVCNPPETYFPLAWLMKLFGTKFLFDHHDLSPEMYDAKFGRRPGLLTRLLRRGLLWCERRTFTAAHGVITTNESHHRIATSRGGKAPDEVAVVRSGPDLQRLQPTEPNPSWRNGRRHLVAYLGEICQQDGVDHLVRAMKILHDRGHRDIQCVLVGGGPHQPAIKSYAEELGLSDVCHFTGRVTDEVLCEVLSTADIGVDPDPYTPWSDQSTMNKIMEYMFFELPIVSYDLTETRVSADQAALYVTPNDEEALANGILDLLEDPLRRKHMGAFGRSRIESELSWEHSQPHLLRAYRRLVA